MTLKITSAEFITSAPSIKEAPSWELPEIALVGRSNVGKSSFINTLLNRKQLAKTSNTPGKTRLLNFYEINHTFAFVDLPGYGYAKVSKTMQAQWQKNFQVYLKQRQNLVLVIQLIDSRLEPQVSDKSMLEWLKANDIPVIIVLTKVDKISRNDLGKHVARTAKVLELERSQITTFSAETGWGKEESLSFVDQYLDMVAAHRPLG